MRRGEAFRLRAPRDARVHEQRGTRYAVVVQSGDLLGLSTVIVALTSTAAQPASFRPEVTIRGVRTRVLVDQIRAVDPSRLGRSAGVLAYDELSEVDSALETGLGLAR